MADLLDRYNLDITNRYVLDFAKRFSERQVGAVILDYGCGKGDVVLAGIDCGLNIFGADIFYAGSQDGRAAQSTGLFGVRICPILGGKLPFESHTFDLVVNNQVFEHVEDMQAALDEIHRVLRPAGTMLSLFPSADVLREGHIGIPFSHWFEPNSRTRFCYTYLLRCLGFGKYKEQSPNSRQWTLDKLAWIDRFTFYRSRHEILRAFTRHFDNRFLEEDYIQYRLLATPKMAWMSSVLRVKLIVPVAREVFRKLGFMVIVSKARNRSLSGSGSV